MNVFNWNLQLNHPINQLKSVALQSFALILGCLLLTSTAHAQFARFWDGSANNNWRNNSNWTGGNSAGVNDTAVMERGVGRNDVDLSNSSGQDVERAVFAIRFRTNGNDTTVPDYFGPNLDLVANWRLRRGRVSVPENTDVSSSNGQHVSWVDTRTDRNEITVLADINIPSGSNIRWGAEGENRCGCNPGSVDDVELMNFYGDISGSGDINLRNFGDSTAPFRSRLVLHESNSFTGRFDIRSTGELFLRDTLAASLASVHVQDEGVLDFQGVNPVLDELDNDSSIDVAGQTLTFGSRATIESEGTFSGTGTIRYVGLHAWSSNGSSTFSGTLEAAGTGPVIASGGSIWSSARIDVQTDNSFTFDTASVSDIGGLSGTGDLTLDANMVLRLVSDRFDSTYSGDLLGPGQLVQMNNNDWTFDGMSEGSIQVESGTLSGGGSMADVWIHPNARISPGVSGAAGDIGSQRFIQQFDVDGTMDVDIDSLGLDQFVVDGQLMLDGASLNLRIDSFPSVPAVIFASYGQRIGEFASVTGLPPNVDLRYDWENLGQIALVANVTPEANDDSYDTLEDVPLIGQNVLGNDVDGDLDTLMVRSAGTFPADGIGGTVVLEPNGDFTYTPPANAFGVANFTYEVEDNNGATDTAVVTITVTPVNDAPSFNLTGGVIAFEDAPFTQSLVVQNSSAGPANEQDQSLFFLISNDNPDLFQIQPSVLASTGEVSFTPAADAFGSAQVELILLDDGGDANGGVNSSPPQTFTITISPVNDPPTFSNIGNISVAANEIGDEIWATGISPGPANESDQKVFFDITSISNPSIFDQLPSIDSLGRLTFTLDVQDLGEEMSDVTVVAVDDGGVDNGGVPTSDSVTFNIGVFPAADLSIEKTSDSFFVDPGGTITYTIVATNNGPSVVFDAVVTDNTPPRLGNLSWTCTTQGDAICGSPSGTGPIDELVSFLSNSSVTYTLTGTLQDTSNEPITNTASVAPPGDVFDFEPGNNSDSDTDAVGLFADGMESEEP